MASIPKDPVILLSYVNTKLRDFYPTLDEFARAEDADKDEIIKVLSAISYSYDSEKNQFI